MLGYCVISSLSVDVTMTSEETVTIARDEAVLAQKSIFTCDYIYLNYSESNLLLIEVNQNLTTTRQE